MVKDNSYSALSQSFFDALSSFGLPPRQDSFFTFDKRYLAAKRPVDGRELANNVTSTDNDKAPWQCGDSQQLLAIHHSWRRAPVEFWPGSSCNNDVIRSDRFFRSVGINNLDCLLI